MIRLDLCKYRKFCRDDISKIENYQEAINSSEQYVLHHRLELTLDGEFAHSREELKRLGMYYHRPYFELIFLSSAEHRRLHDKGVHPMRGKHHSEESRKKMSDARKGKFTGKNNSFYGKIHSCETRQRISEALKAAWARRRQPS